MTPRTKKALKLLGKAIDLLKEMKGEDCDDIPRLIERFKRKLVTQVDLTILVGVLRKERAFRRKETFAAGYSEEYVENPNPRDHID